MKIAKYMPVYEWLLKIKSDASYKDLQNIATERFGPIEWRSESGHFEGLITCKFTKLNIIGQSDGDCTYEEALCEAVLKCLEHKDYQI